MHVPGQGFLEGGELRKLLTHTVIYNKKNNKIKQNWGFDFCGKSVDDLFDFDFYIFVDVK